MIIDCHGHYTTAPAELEAWRKRQIAAIDDPSKAPRRDELVIGDDAIRDSLEGAQLRMQRERGTDLTIFSPRASFMAHHIGNEATSREWTEVCNDLVREAGAQGTELMAWMAARAALPGHVTKVHSHYHVPISNTAGGLLALQNDEAEVAKAA